MKIFTSFILNKEYKRLEKPGDKLAEVNRLIDWEAFRPIVRGMYKNQTERGGRHSMDEVLMIKLIVLQQWHRLSDPELERKVADRISFCKFLDFPETIPDYSTAWYFKERMAETGKDREIWMELQKQLDSKGLKVKEGVIQDATFITADPGHAPADKPRGPEAQTRKNKDRTWTKKGNKSRFGYKLHTKTDIDYGLIRELETTTASVHDSQIDLSQKGEVVYRDRGYFGTPCMGYSVTMQHRVRGKKFNIRDKLRNRRISRKRTSGEMPYAVIKQIFKSTHILVTTLKRTGVKMIFVAFSYNLQQLKTLKKTGLAIAI